MTIHILAVIILSGLSSFFAAFLCIRTFMLFLKKLDFRVLGRALALLDMFAGFTCILFGEMFKMYPLYSVGILFLACFSIGLCWVNVLENSNPYSGKKTLLYIIIFTPFLVLLTFAFPFASLAPLMDTVLTRNFAIWNVIGSGALFFMWFGSVLISRLRDVEIYLATSAFIFFGASVFLIYDHIGSMVTAATFLYLIGITTFSYTWVTHEKGY